MLEAYWEGYGEEFSQSRSSYERPQRPTHGLFQVYCALQIVPMAWYTSFKAALYGS